MKKFRRDSIFDAAMMAIIATNDSYIVNSPDVFHKTISTGNSAEIVEKAVDINMQNMKKPSDDNRDLPVRRTIKFPPINRERINREQSLVED